MSTFNQKLDSMKESIASLFKTRRTSRSSACTKLSQRSISTSSNNSANTANCNADDNSCTPGTTTANSISTPQNVRRVLHITFDAGRQSFNGIPQHWQSYFDSAGSTAGNTAEAAIAETDEETTTGNDDSGVSMATNPNPTSTDEPPPKPPKELLSLTYDRNSGKFVDLPSHWRERLERNNLLEPEFQKNPELLVSVFAMMDEELKAMSQEGLCLDKGMYSSSPALESKDGLQYVYEIEADSSNSSSEHDLHLPAVSFDCSHSNRNRRPSLVRMRAVSAPTKEDL